LLHRLAPNWYVPLYVLIEFTRTPYADALRRARTQDHVVRAALLALLAFLAALVLLALRLLS
jgi:kynurenine 3-monooxygenase